MLATISKNDFDYFQPHRANVRCGFLWDYRRAKSYMRTKCCGSYSSEKDNSGRLTFGFPPSRLGNSSKLDCARLGVGSNSRANKWHVWDDSFIGTNRALRCGIHICTKKSAFKAAGATLLQKVRQEQMPVGLSMLKICF